MSVSNGQIANQTTFNNAFVSRTSDTSASGQVDLLNDDAESGAHVENIQRELNGEASFTGRDLNGDFNELPNWNNNDVGDPSDNLKDRADALTERFNPTTGHTHDGVDSPYVEASDLASTRLRGYLVRATGLLGVTGSSLDVSSYLMGKTPSTSDTTKGVVVSPSNNKIILRDGTAATQDDQLRDSNGDIIYGRLTYLTGVWTLSFYKNAAGSEVSHSFTTQDITWYYQELFNPIVDAPIYSELVSIPSDNATQDVVDATASQRGLVSTGPQSFGGAKTFADTTQSTNKDSGCVILEGGLGVEKNINAGGTILGSNLSGTNTGDVTLANVGSSPNAQAASLSGQQLTLQPASSSFPGVVSTGAQSFAGVKTFADTTQSTDKDTGSLVLEGGLGVEKNINAGGNVAATGTVTGSNLSGTNTGDQTITLTGDVTGSGTGSFATTIANDAVTNAKLANMATQTIKGRTTAGTGDPEDLTATQATAILNTFVGDSGSGGTKGLVPAPAAGDAAAGKFLKADGTFAVPAASSGGSGMISTDLSTVSTTINSGDTLTHPNLTIDTSHTYSIAGTLICVGKDALSGLTVNGTLNVTGTVRVL